MPKHAACHCGAVTAEIADDAEAMVMLCHCLDCQKRSGSPFGTIAYYAKEHVRLSGEVTEYSRPTDQGNSFTHAFCPICGSAVWAKASMYPDKTGVTLGAFADPMFGPPTRSVYERSKHYWVALPANVPRHPMGRNS